jgi:hypothetical protein
MVGTQCTSCEVQKRLGCWQQSCQSGRERSLPSHSPGSCCCCCRMYMNASALRLLPLLLLLSGVCAGLLEQLMLVLLLCKHGLGTCCSLAAQNRYLPLTVLHAAAFVRCLCWTTRAHS